VIGALKLVYGDPELHPPACRINTTVLGFSGVDEPIDSKIRKKYGKWTSSPDPPRTDSHRRRSRCGREGGNFQLSTFNFQL